MSHSQFHCTSRAYLDMHGLIFETSICYWQDQPGRSAVSQRQPAPPRRGAAQGLPVGRTCQARGAHAAAAAAAATTPRSAGARRGGSGNTLPTRHGPPLPATASEADWPGRATADEGTPAAAARRGEGRSNPPHTGAAPMAARGRGRGTGRPHRGRGGPARAPAGRGEPGRSPTPPHPGGRQRAAATATAAGRDPTHARARAPERGGGARRRAGGTVPRPHTTPPPGRRRQTRMGGRNGPEKHQRTGARHRVGRQTGGGRETTARRQGAQALETGAATGEEDRGPPRGSTRGPQRRLPRPEVGRQGARGPTAQGLQHKGGPAAPEDTDPAPGGPWPPRGARAPGHHATVTTDPPTGRSPARTTTPLRAPLDWTRAGLSSSQGAESPSPGDDRPPEPLGAGEGTTPNSGEAGFGPEGVDRGHSAPFSRPGEPGTRQGGKGRRRRGGGAQRATADSAWGAVRGGRVHQRRRKPGHQVNVHGIPPPPARERSRDARGHRPASAPLAHLPPANRAPHRRGSTPRDPRPEGPRLNLHPSVWSVPEPRPGGKRPQARAARPVPARHRRRRLGTGAGSRQLLARRRAGDAHRGGVAARTLARTREAPRARRRPGPAGSSPDSEGGGAGRGRQESDARPHRGAGRPLEERGLCPTRNGSHPASVATTRRGGAAAGGSGTPRHPLGSLEKAFSPRAHRPHPFVTPPTGPRKTASQRPPGPGGRGGSAVRDRHRAILSARGQSPTRGPPLPLHTGHAPVTARKEPRASLEATRGAETGTACWAKEQQPSAGQAPQRWLGPARSLTRPTWHHACQGTTRRPHPHRGGAGGPPLPTPPPALRTHHRQRWPKGGGRWERETTPPLGLRHLRQPGALQGHHREPGATRSARPGG